MLQTSPRIASRQFVGRRSELDALCAVIDAAETTVVMVHGIAGVGKTALLRALVDLVDGDGTSVISLDCRMIEPTERGFLQAVGNVGDVTDFTRSLEDHGRRPVLVCDHFEQFRLMDTWFRQFLVPALPRGTTVILAARERPGGAWFSMPAFGAMPLGPLSDEDAGTLLADTGLSPPAIDRATKIGRGHPLALVLAAAGISEHPELSLENAAVTRVVSALTRVFLEDVQDQATRSALEAGSVVRRITGSLLRTMLGEGFETDDLLGRLIDLPFVDPTLDGLMLHEAVREAVAGYLRAAHPDRYVHYRRAAWRELRGRAHDAAPTELWGCTADMLYLIDNPVVREAFFPSGGQPLAVEAAPRTDSDAIERIARRHETPLAAEALAQWWDSAPETVSVARDRDGEVRGFFILLAHRHLVSPRTNRDPVARAWAAHLREHRLPPGQVALGFRRWLDAEAGEAPCATQAASWLDVKREYMALRPRLRRIYVTVTDVATYWPIVQRLGFRPLPGDPPVLDGVAHASVLLDFGPGSVDGWLSNLVAAELGLDVDGRTLDDDTRDLVVCGRRVPLTPLEFGVLRHLSGRAGKVITRQEFLRDVWGTGFTGGSNVVDVVVRSLRRKLGDGASRLQTVRGSGYRLAADWQTV
jgi:Transcriptional regulatory protein, C terminal/AAA ATPase domain